METKLLAEYLSATKFGKLLIIDPVNLSKGSHKKINWICDCGKITTCQVCHVISGNTSSCGHCDEISAEEMRIRKFGKLRMKEPNNLMPGSRIKKLWVCDCGNEVLCQPLSVISGHTSSCGHCNELSSEYFSITKFGSLRMKTPITSLPRSKIEAIWVCDCGNETIRPIQLVTSGHTSSCGKCKHSNPDYWTGKTYGKLTRRGNEKLSKGSNKKVMWICTCGNETEQSVYSVTSKKVNSCGNCMSIARNWYKENEEVIKNLKCPIQPEDIPSGWMCLLEPVTNTGIAFNAVCGSCKNRYKPIWDNIRKGSSLTCGCASNHTSGASMSIASFIESLGVVVELEYEVNNLFYDIFVPSANMLIEYNGLRWHQGAESRERDLRKYRNTISLNYPYLMIFEDEWLYNQDKVKNLLRNKLIKSSPIPIRPQKCKICQISKTEANPFYESFHYIGKCNAKVHYGVFFEDHLIAAMSFSHPTRQTSSHP
ncbi:MAG: zinc-ribbon domain-containing protein, partial [Erysipelotrichaceae bacterium]|nr:zinc-ribbon domain-containing protein [Erysipelotrichaceae bacterium]